MGVVANMCEIIPSPGTEQKDWPAMEKRIEMVAPFTKTIHIDIVDGKFAPNTSFLDPNPFKKFTNQLFFEVHLMVEEPYMYLKPFADAGFKRFIGHIEKMTDQAEFVAQGQLLGEVGLAIDGKTSLDAVQVPYDDLDCLLIMTINAGFSGQAFMPEHLEKVKAVRSKNPLLPTGMPLPIEIDGGVNRETIVTAKEAGVSRVIVTSAIYNQPDLHGAYQSLVDAVK